MEKLRFLGIGPKIARVLLPWLAVTTILSIVWHAPFKFISGSASALTTAGVIFLSFWFLFYIFTIIGLLRGLKQTRLITSGTYYFCQNPLYASIILFLIPGLSLMLNSWLILTSSVIGYVVFKVHIVNEYKELEHFFGESYLKYKSITPEFFPFPVKKMMR